MSGAQPLEELQRTLEEAGRQVGRELREAATLQANPEVTIREREQVVSESLQNAAAYYKKKEYTRAFIEWERACNALGAGEELRAKIRALKESHDNLSKVNRELADIRMALNQRAAPTVEDVKFVEGAHEVVKGQVKNGYAYLSQQLRTERTQRGLSFWWPVGLALLIITLGFMGLKVSNESALARIKAARTALPLPAPAVVSPASSSAMDDTFLQAQKAASEKQMDELRQENIRQIEEMHRKSAQAAQADREKIIQLETGIKEQESKNAELGREIKALMDDNLNKDRTISSLT